MIFATKALLQTNSNPSAEQIRHALEGNMCRCTGYQNIVRSVQAAAAAGATVMATTVRRSRTCVRLGIKRREDPRLLTGTARYTADMTLPGSSTPRFSAARTATRASQRSPPQPRRLRRASPPSSPVRIPKVSCSQSPARGSCRTRI
jgi:hypothetical protein